MKIEHNYMHYFKTEADSKNVSASLGGVSLETVDWVRPYDNTPGKDRNTGGGAFCLSCIV